MSIPLVKYSPQLEEGLTPSYKCGGDLQGHISTLMYKVTVKSPRACPWVEPKHFL